jgi:hypothetical protein
MVCRCFLVVCLGCQQAAAAQVCTWRHTQGQQKGGLQCCLSFLGGGADSRLIVSEQLAGGANKLRLLKFVSGETLKASRKVCCECCLCKDACRESTVCAVQLPVAVSARCGC